MDAPFLQPAEPSVTRAARYPSLDVARGLIMIVMALDHASMAWNSGRVFLEGAPGIPPVQYPSLMQQFTREITHLCAPGFQLLAGMGLAISVWRRRQQGQSEWSINGDMVLRGLALIFCEFVLLHYAYGEAWWMFAVLACIGCNIIIFSAARRLPLSVIAGLSLAVLLAAPLYAPETIAAPTASGYLRNILTNVALGRDAGGFMVLYPILPWIACFGIGWCLGTAYERGRVSSGAGLVGAGAVMTLAGILLRWFSPEYADRLPNGDGPWSAAFWALTKYPPSPAFLLITIGLMILLLGLLRRLDLAPVLPRWARIPVTYGRVALFFYVVHLYLYESYPAATGQRNQFGLATTYAVWLAGLVVLWWPCVGYHRLREWYRTVLRYF